MTALDYCYEIHAEVARKGWLERGPFVGSTVVHMYGALAKAQEVLDKLLDQDAVSWNALITGYTNMGLLRKLQAGGSLEMRIPIEAIEKGLEVHA